MKKTLIILIFIHCFLQRNIGQNDSSFAQIQWNAYTEIYYTYDFSEPSNHIRPKFLCSYNRHNEVSINLGFIKSSYQSKNVRGNLSLAVGTYMNTNLASEPNVFKNIFEANVGVKLSSRKNIWIDAGIFTSHIGFETAIGKNNWTLTRSILADNTPYYESGINLNYTTSNNKWYLSLLILNGWQRIHRINDNNTICFGHQITYKYSDKFLLNSSSFIGTDTPDSIHLMRYFHNFYTQFYLSSHFGMILGFDIGIQEQSKNNTSYNVWYSPIWISQWRITSKWQIATRVEYYVDANQVIISTATPNGFQVWGYSINIDYIINNYCMWRIEGRSFLSKDNIFGYQGMSNVRNSNYHITSALILAF